MALDGHLGKTKREATQRERACFLEAWTHQAVMRAASEQEEAYPQLSKLADYEANTTFLAAEVQKLDDELASLQEALGEEHLVAQLLQALRRATQQAISEGENLYFFGDRATAAQEAPQGAS